MAISTTLDTFGGLPVIAWNPGDALPEPSGSAVRIALSYKENDGAHFWRDKFAALLDMPGVEQLAGLVVGAGEWLGTFDGEGGTDDLVEVLVAARHQLPNLKVLFISDVTYEECEISWIEHSDYAPLFAAYPQLEAFGVRGSNGLSLSDSQLRHANLRQLTIESGGLDRSIVTEVLSADLPELTHLELWLGTPDYEGDVEIEDLQPLLGATSTFPKLRYLGLRNAEIADEIAVAIANASIVDQLEVLDLSLGTLGDEGVEALLASEKVLKLKKLDVRHFFASLDLRRRLEALPIEVDTREWFDEHTDEDDRYVSVGE